MGNVRVFQLARDLNLSSQEVIERLHKLGLDLKTASSSVDEDTCDKLKRALKIDQLAARKKRVYGSEEEEAEREAERRVLEDRIAAERAERERAAAEAAAARANRGKKGAAKTEPEKPAARPEETPLLSRPPGAPRLAPKAPPSAVAVLDDEAGEQLSEGAEEEPVAEAAPEPEPEPEPEAPAEEAAPQEAPEEVVATAPPVVAPVPAPAVAPASVAAPRLAPRVTGPLRPIAPPPPPVAAEPTPEPEPAPAAAAPIAPIPAPQVTPIAPIAPPAPSPVATPIPPAPVAAAPSAPATTPAPVVARPIAPVARPIAPRPVRPIAPPPRPVPPMRPPSSPHPTSPHATAGAPLPRSPHMVARPGMPGARPGMGGPVPGRPPGAQPLPQRPTSRSRVDRSKGLPAPVQEARPVYSGPPRKLQITEGVTVKELSDKMVDVKGRDIMKALITRGVMVTVNQTLDPKLAMDICKEFGYEASIQSFEEEVVQIQTTTSKPEDLVPRAPVITVMGHVDHGKTSLLDAIRETKVAAGEAGGITQHIGAYHVEVGSRRVVFLDTPGHEAFTLMRARGAKVTDIVVLVVAADDGVMPQTIEAVDHARAAGVPIVVAVNKIDKPQSQPDRVRQQLSDRGLQPEEWGGSTVYVNVSAKKHQNLDQLLEMLLLVADMQDLKADPKKPAVGTVLEARLDKGRGPVATVLIQDGTLSVGDTVVAGAVQGKVRALVDDHGERLKSAGPSTPVEVLGLQTPPEPGDQLMVVTDSLKAQAIVSFRQQKQREKAMAVSSRISLEDLGKAIADGQLKELPLVVKGDVQGSIEAVVDQLAKIPQEKIKLRVIRSGVGAITEGDVLLATASNAVVIGFNVRPERKAADLAERDEVDIRLYTVIYDAVEDMRKALEGMLAPTIKEIRLGSAEVKDTFKISKVGTIAGCFVADGRITRQAQIRLLRDNVVIHTGKISSLKRFKDDVNEVRSGQECGVGIAGYNDLKPGDVIEFFTTEQVKTLLES